MTQIFPSLASIGWPTRSIEWGTRKLVNISGKEVAIADRARPRYIWEYPFEVLRHAEVAGDNWTEFDTLFGFYNLCSGGALMFWYADPDDGSVTAQNFGTGDGTTRTFQLVRPFGGFAEYVLAPYSYTIYISGVSTTAYTQSNGVITFNSAPVSGAALTWTGSYYWQCRFVEDQCAFQKLTAGRYSCRSLKFKSVL